jgi:6-pyruvoyltetrahydropterin/6-carboxytetrahydropterin synthase
VEIGFHIDEVDFETTKQKYALVLKEISQKLDHEHLNFSVPEFKTHIPTTENIAIYFHEKLKKQISEDKIALIRLYEMNDLWTEIRL